MRAADTTFDNVGRCMRHAAVPHVLDPRDPLVTAVAVTRVDASTTARYYTRRCVLRARHRGACQVETATGRQLPVER